MFIFLCNSGNMEKKVLTTATTTAVASEYGLPFLVFTLFFNVNWLDIIQKTVPRFASFLQSKFALVCSVFRAEKGSDSAPSRPVSACIADGRSEMDLRREDAEMVMARLGFSCAPESEGESNFGSDRFTALFEENEPSLEELKEAFDVFDENKDGFVDAGELQRVLRLLGLTQRTEIGDCARMIESVDKNRDGKIDFRVFVKLMENTFS